VSILSIRIEVNHVADGLGKPAAVNAGAGWNAIGEVEEDGVDGLSVVHIGFLQFADGAGDDGKVEVESVVGVCHSSGAIVKVILETDYVNREEDIIRLCEICTNVGADYVKTSTGYGFVKGEDGKYSYAGATIQNLELMENSVGPGVKVKAAGGVRTLDGLLAVREAGCSRCGATATISMMEDAKERFGA